MIRTITPTTVYQNTNVTKPTQNFCAYKPNNAQAITQNNQVSFTGLQQITDVMKKSKAGKWITGAVLAITALATAGCAGTLVVRGGGFHGHGSYSSVQYCENGVCIGFRTPNEPHRVFIPQGPQWYEHHNNRINIHPHPPVIRDQSINRLLNNMCRDGLICDGVPVRIPHRYFGQ